MMTTEQIEQRIKELTERVTQTINEANAAIAFTNGQIALLREMLETPVEGTEEPAE